MKYMIKAIVVIYVHVYQKCYFHNVKITSSYDLTACIVRSVQNLKKHVKKQGKCDEQKI